MATAVATGPKKMGDDDGAAISWARLLPALGPLVALVLACAFFATQSDRFLTTDNLSLVIQQVAVVGTVSIGQTILIIAGGIDLSAGAVMTLGTIVMAKLAGKLGVDPYLAIAAGFGVCAAFGAFNGALVTRFRLPPFIVTLGMLNIAFALTHIYSNEETIARLPDPLNFFGQTFSVGGTLISYGSVLMVVVFAVAWFFLKYTAGGRHAYAVGNNPEAARLTGIRVSRLLLTMYTLAGVTYAIAALLLVGRTGVGDPNAGQTINLESITAVVLGGTSLFGGRGGVLGTLIGSLIVGVFRNGLLLMGLPPIAQVLITGILVILAVSVDQVSRRAQR
jgi:fructose transport system permease protein